MFQYYYYYYYYLLFIIIILLFPYSVFLTIIKYSGFEFGFSSLPSKHLFYFTFNPYQAFFFFSFFILLLLLLLLLLTTTNTTTNCYPLLSFQSSLLQFFHLPLIIIITNSFDRPLLINIAFAALHSFRLFP